jgi:signal transduction histidine kinase
MRAHSLVRRATLAVIAIELACAIGVASTAIWHEREARLHALDATLSGRVDSLIGAVQDAEDPQDNVKIDPDEFSPPPNDQYAVYNPDGRLVGTSHGDLSAVTLKQRDGIQSLRSKGRGFRVLQRRGMRIIDRFETAGVGLRRPVIVVYAMPSDRVWHEVLEATRFYVLLSLGSVALTAAILIVLARRLLRPLNELATAAASIQPAELAFASPASAMSTRELRPLGEALEQMTARLRAAFEAQKRFISDAAHELKTAAAVVHSTIQVLGMKARSADEYQTGLGRILDDHQRVEELISRMLTLARLDEQRSAPEASIDLSEHTEKALSLLTTYAESKGVTLKFVDSSTHAMVRMTPESLDTLVSNLAMNAVQHSPLGSQVLVIVSAERQAATLEVRDFGEGISNENIPHVFERFFREDTSRSRETGGIGLGLSICKSIVDRAGGSIEIHSRKGEGTAVTVRFARA